MDLFQSGLEFQSRPEDTGAGTNQCAGIDRWLGRCRPEETPTADQPMQTGEGGPPDPPPCGIIDRILGRCKQPPKPDPNKPQTPALKFPPEIPSTNFVERLYSFPAGSIQRGIQRSVEQANMQAMLQGIKGPERAALLAETEGRLQADAGRQSSQFAQDLARAQLAYGDQFGYVPGEPNYTAAMYDALIRNALGVGSLTGVFSSPLLQPGQLSDEQLKVIQQQQQRRQTFSNLFQSLIPFLLSFITSDERLKTGIRPLDPERALALILSH
jgi:hypothetical protein